MWILDSRKIPLRKNVSSIVEFGKQRHAPPRVRRAFRPLLCRTAPRAVRLILKVTAVSVGRGKQTVLCTWDCWRHQQSRTGARASVLGVPGPGCQLGHCWEILPYSAFWETQPTSKDDSRKIFEDFEGCLSPFLEMLPSCGTWELQRKKKGPGRVIWFSSRWRSSSKIYSYTSLIRVESCLWAQSNLRWTLRTACCLRICGISLNNTENTTRWVLCLKGKKCFFRKRNKKSVFYNFITCMIYIW